MNIINKWLPGGGFLRPLVLPLSFKHNFHRADFRVVIQEYYPYIYVNGTDADGHTIVKGDLTFQTLDTLSKAMNATFRYIPGSTIIERQAYFISHEVQLYGVIIKMQDLQHIYGVNTACHSMDQLGIVSAKPPRGMSWYGLVSMFDGRIWPCVILSWLIGGFVLYRLINYTTNGHQANFGNSYWILVQIILWDSIRCDSHHISVYFLLITYILGIFIVVTLYCGEIIAAMLAQDYINTPIENLEQLWASDMTVLAHYPRNITYAYRYNKTPDRFDTYIPGKGTGWFVPALKIIRNNPRKYVSIMKKYGVIESTLKVFMTDWLGNHEFYVGKEVFEFLCSNFPVQKDAYYEEAVNRGIMTIHAAGIRLHLGELYDFKDFVTNMKEKRTRPIISTDPQVITLEHGFGAGLVAMFVGHAVALLAFILELIYKKCEAAYI